MLSRRKQESENQTIVRLFAAMLIAEALLAFAIVILRG